jgi:hypothetical protein
MLCTYVCGLNKLPAKFNNSAQHMAVSSSNQYMQPIEEQYCFGDYNAVLPQRCFVTAPLFLNYILACGLIGDYNYSCVSRHSIMTH